MDPGYSPNMFRVLVAKWIWVLWERGWTVLIGQQIRRGPLCGYRKCEGAVGLGTCGMTMYPYVYVISCESRLATQPQTLGQVEKTTGYNNHSRNTNTCNK